MQRQKLISEQVGPRIPVLLARNFGAGEESRTLTKTLQRSQAPITSIPQNLLHTTYHIVLRMQGRNTNYGNRTRTCTDG